MKSVLIVEDDKSIRETLRMVLEAEGYQVGLAENGKIALEYLREHSPPGIILLDLMMPVMNGWEFLKRHEEDPVLAAVPVVVISAALSVKSLVGASHFFSKPIELDALLGIIRGYCH